MIKCVDAYDTRQLRTQCTSNKGTDRSTKEHRTMCWNNKSISRSKSTARSARHTTMPADKTQVSLMRFTDERHQPRIHQTIRKGDTSGEYITRTLRIVRNDEIYHGLKDSQVVKKVSLITFMDRHHDLTTREYNRRLARQKCKTRGTLQIITRSVRIYGSYGSTSHFKFTTRYDPWYWTIFTKLVSKNKKEKSRNYECLQINCALPTQIALIIFPS